ncbi:nucleotide exchange factor GrpE [Opitutaceae bacterium EW11]|nr:nucleotide exchange factor GrpE [Opitutaceae bacterium EW11]
MTAPDQAGTSDNSPAPDSIPENLPAMTDAAPASESVPPPEAHKIEEELAAAKKEAAENYDRYVRTVADLDNFRRRSMREKDELRQYAAGKVLEDLLPALDNLALGLAAAKAANADLKTLQAGIGMVQEQLRSALSNHGLREVNPVGQAFDPHQHEAVSSLPSQEVPEGSVLQVVRVGYTLNSRLLRPASVVISSGPAKEEPKSAQ